MRCSRRRLIVRNRLVAGVGTLRRNGQDYLQQGRHAGEITSIDLPGPLFVPTKAHVGFHRSTHLNCRTWDQSP